jgi:DNA repair exonuclease SbcCD ATPase subunit
MDELKKLHDEHLANKPDSMSDEDYASIIDEHKETCPFCNEKLIAQNDPEEGGDMDTFTQEELDAAVSAAVAPIQAELQEIKDSAAESEVDTRVAEAKAEADERVAELQGQLEAAVLEAQAAKTELAELHTFLESEKEATELAELYEAIKADRKAKIAEVASFPEDFLEANLDRWCAEDEDAFAARLEEWKVTSKKEETVADEANLSDEALRSTAMQSVRPVQTDAKIKGDLANLFAAGTAGYDIKKL